jgi:hypothetical protein
MIAFCSMFKMTSPDVVFLIFFYSFVVSQMSAYKRLEETTPVVNYDKQSPFEQYAVQYELDCGSIHNRKCKLTRGSCCGVVLFFFFFFFFFFFSFAVAKTLRVMCPALLAANRRSIVPKCNRNYHTVSLCSPFTSSYFFFVRPVHVFFNIFKAVVGAGSFALPLAFKKGGIWGSLIGLVRAWLWDRSQRSLWPDNSLLCCSVCLV